MSNHQLTDSKRNNATPARRACFMPSAVLLAAVAAAAGCRPPAATSLLYDTSTDNHSVSITQNGTKTTIKPDSQDFKLKKLGDLAVLELKGSVDAPKSKRYHATEPLKFRLTIEAETDRVCKSGESGTGLSGKVSLACVSDSALTSEVKKICKELAADSSIATYDESQTWCTCHKRKTPRLEYTGYRENPQLFRAECRNSGSAADVKAVCTDIRDRLCKTCKVESLSCECPGGKTLSFSSYLDNLEGFRQECSREVVTNVAAQEKEFSEACAKVGTVKLESSKPVSCACTTGTNSVQYSAWTQDKTLLAKSCTTNGQTNPNTGSIPDASGISAEDRTAFKASCERSRGTFVQPTGAQPYCQCKPESLGGSTYDLEFDAWKDREAEFEGRCTVSPD